MLRFCGSTAYHDYNVDATRSQRSILIVPFALVYTYIVPAFFMDHAV